MKTKLIYPSIFILAVLLVGIHSHTIAQADPGKYYPWPPLFQPIPKELFHPRSPSSFFTTDLHLDTATFTPVSAGLPGVIAGDAIWIDYDNDGDLDILMSGVLDTNRYIMQLYRNDNGVFTPTDALVDSIAT